MCCVRLESQYLDLARSAVSNPEKTLCVKKSDIHGWGLFTKAAFQKVLL
jgi:hypothetical protein